MQEQFFIKFNRIVELMMIEKWKWKGAPHVNH
jgi:hypothetical protein